MAEAKEKWDDVGDRFTALGHHLKDRFDANVAYGDDEKEKVNAALRQIGDAIEAGFNAIGDAWKDPGVRSELKQAGNAIGDAIAATFDAVGDEIRKVGRK